VSRGGKTTKIHAVVDGLGNPVYLQLSAGNEADCAVAVDVLSHVPLAGSMVLADRGYDSDEILVYIEDQDARHTIPPKANRIYQRKCDWWLYKERHLVECFFNKLEHFRRVATRYDKLPQSFFAFVLLASISILVK
jgi:Transposase and inactivated derivatives